MARARVGVRPATIDDVSFLVDLWQDQCRRVDRAEQAADLELAVKTAEKSPEQRLIIAEIEAVPVGAVLLQLGIPNPINPEPCVMVLAPTVVPGARRQGVGRTLLEEAVAFGEELGVTHLATAVDTASRDANRFMARVGLAPRATLRAAPLAVVLSKVAPAAGARAGSGRQLGQILAARRSMRRPSPLPPA